MHLQELIEKGVIKTKPGIERVDGATVHFLDGSKDDFDLIILATGGFAEKVVRTLTALRSKGKNKRGETLNPIIIAYTDSTKKQRKE